MGMSIDMHVYDIEKLKLQLESNLTVKEGQMTPSELLDKIMPEAGIVANGLFILQSADYWDDYDPWTSTFRVIERYYQYEDVYTLFDDAEVARKYDGCGEEDLAEAAGIENLPPHPDDEEEED